MTTQDYYTYAFFNDEWGVPFYVGKGRGNRYVDLSGRSNHIQSIWSHYPCHSEILFSELNEQDALQLERKFKQLYQSLGFPIIDHENPKTSEAQRTGIERAKAEGKYKGRKPMDVDTDALKVVCGRWRAGEITAITAMKEVGLKPNTFYRRVKELHL